MIVTVDAAILVRACKGSDGPARKLLETLASDDRHEIALSPFILGEVGKSLSRPRLAGLYSLNADLILEHLQYLRAIARIIEPAPGLPVILSDPHDDPVLYTAIAAGAHVLCTRDRAFYAPHVTRCCQRYGLSVMDELQLLAILQRP